MTTEIASPDFFAKGFEALVRRVAADEDFTPKSLPNFGVVEGEPRPLPDSGEARKPVELRHALSVLLEHYFQAEERHHETIPTDKRENNIVEHWVTVLNCLDNQRSPPESFLGEPPATRMPCWLTLLILALTLPTLLYFPVLLTS